MPNSDFSAWADPKKMASIIKRWSEGKERPKSGSFVVMGNVNGETVATVVE